MNWRLADIHERLRASYWFVPATMAVLAAALAIALVWVDRLVEESGRAVLGWTYAGGPSGARAVLSTIAAGVITVAGVTFSVTVATLSLASSQFGPRLLRNFMRDRGNQIVLGTLIATHVYSLLVLRTVRGENGEMVAFVPQLSITVAVVLAAASVGVLIYFVHHVARIIQAPIVVANVAAELSDAIDRLFPERMGDDADGADVVTDALPAPGFDDNARTVDAPCNGYVQLVDADDLMDAAKRHDLVVRLLRRPGAFVRCGEPLAQVWRADRATSEACRAILHSIRIGSESTPTQDVLFTANQLVEVAIRAMSPAVNDPFTAMACVEWLGAAMVQLGQRRWPAAARCDASGAVRVIAEPVSFDEFVRTTTRPIYDHARELATPIVCQRLERVLHDAAAQLRAPARRAVLVDVARHLRAVDETD